MKLFTIFLTMLISSSLFSAELSLIRATSSLSSKYGVYAQPINFLIKAKNLDLGEIPVINESGRIIIARKVQEMSKQGETLWEAEALYSNRNYMDDPEWTQPRDLNFFISTSKSPSQNINQEVFELEKDEGALLGNGIQLINSEISYDLSVTNNFYYGLAFVKNLSPEKSVKVHYTTNNWKTIQVTEAKYVEEYYIGYSVTHSPNSHGNENWVFLIPLISSMAGSTLEYALSYEINGQTIWDNNFGLNYTVNLH